MQGTLMQRKGESKITYNVDIVFCIDATESMDNVIHIVKRNAINLYSDVMNVMAKKGKIISKIRLKVIIFRDYLADGDEAMMMTDFFDLPGDAEDFKECVDSIVAEGGGDDPEDGLEALAYAIDSDWNRSGMKKRHVIAVWSDAETHPIGYGRSFENYPEGMVSSFRELTDCWNRQDLIDQGAKRLLLFTPDLPYWKQISENWDNVIHYPSIAGDGLKDITYNQIINSISNTI